jgi:prepilin-type N-terminal cleavage/methylation domain-containing protein
VNRDSAAFHYLSKNPAPGMHIALFSSGFMTTSLHLHSHTGTRGFTLVEVLVAAALLGIVAASSIWALTQANNYAAISRLYTGAETAAQNQVDYLMSDSPFNPQSSEYGTTNEWTLGTGTAQTVTIYSDPAGAAGKALTITGQMVTTVKDTGLTTASQGLNLYYATVIVTYTFRSKTYTVQLNAMRASDV